MFLQLFVPRECKVFIEEHFVQAIVYSDLKNATKSAFSCSERFR